MLDEIDCVIIDEFQDTNPVQFALLWHLGKHAQRTLLVGDVKQSIMGFQGADPRLSVALAAAYPDTTDPLKNNYRSTPAVMQFVNALGQGLFGNAYEHLTPDRKAVEGTALELLNATNGRAVRNTSRPPAHIAERIARILVDGETVTDRHSSVARRARPSDIALLVCRHTTAARYAEELRARGVPVRIAENGWSASPAVQAARAALAYAANPADFHSALVLRTLGPDPLPLQTALSLQIDGLLMDDPVLVRLAALSDHLLRLPVPDALNLVLQATGLHEWAIALPEGAQARADLLRLEAEADAFATAHRDLKAASGFHGDTPKVFLGWLDARTAERDFDRRPDPSADVAEAVEIVTWHASKGREWPITVVAEFDYDIEERPGTTATHFEALDQIDDMSAVLASAKLVHTPKLAAPEAQSRFIESRRPDFESNARNLLYVALTRARDRLIIEWPSFLKERDTDASGATCLFHVLEDACHPKIGQGTLRVSGVECPAEIRTLPAQAGLTMFGAGEAKMPAQFGLIKPLPRVTQTPWRLNPSQLTSNEPPPATQEIFLGEPWDVGPSDAVRGTALHLAMRTYLTRPNLAVALPAATGLDAEVLKNVAERARSLKEWLSSQRFPGLYCEIPVLSAMVNGAELSGTIDLVAAGPSGCLIIDHKTGGPGAGLGQYWPQLSCYRVFATGVMPDKTLKGVGIFWIDYGRLDLVSVL